MGTPSVLQLGAPWLAGSYYYPDHPDLPATCLNCPGQHCIAFSQGELGAAASVRGSRVCPTDAISFDGTGLLLSVSDSCVQCGLCVLRCPFGALVLSDLRPILGVAPIGKYVSVDNGAFEIFNARLARRPGAIDIEGTLDRLVAAAKDAKQSEFYSLVANLFTAAGIPTALGNQGDTSSRMDAVAIDPTESIPMEIKSPTESLYINVKSVQQALENKIVLAGRRQFPTQRNTTSLAVGFQYPADRSDVQRLIEDIWGTYRISIGTIDLRSLYRIALRKTLMGETADLDRLRRLKGVL